MVEDKVTEDKVTVKFAYIGGEDPSICEVNGTTTVLELIQMERDATHDEVFEADGYYLCECIWFPGERGSWGDMIVSPAWQFNVLDFTPVEPVGDLLEHCRKVAKEVATWPAWKREGADTTKFLEG